MRVAKDIYWVYLEKLGASNIGDIKVPIDGVYYNIEEIPDSYIEAMFNCSKEELYESILEEVTSSELEDSINDL